MRALLIDSLGIPLSGINSYLSVSSIVINLTGLKKENLS